MGNEVADKERELEAPFVIGYCRLECMLALCFNWLGFQRLEQFH